MEAATFVTLEQAYGFSDDPITKDDSTVSSITGFSASINTGSRTPGDSAKTCDNIPSELQNACTLSTDSRVCVYINTTSTTNQGQVQFDATRIQETYVLAMTKCMPEN